MVSVGAQIHARPTSKEGQCAVVRAVNHVFLVLLPRLLIRPPHDGAQQGQYLDALGVAFRLGGCLSRMLYPRPCHFGSVCSNKDDLRVLAHEHKPNVEGIRLQDDAGSLQRRLTDLWTRHFIVLALVVDPRRPRGIMYTEALASCLTTSCAPLDCSSLYTKSMPSWAILCPFTCRT